MVVKKKTVKTNIGEMPLEDYLDIRAFELGFDDYDDMVSNGYKIEFEEGEKKND